MATFKTKRRPDAVSASMNLDQHIANTNADPHPQYLLKSEISDEFHIDISSLLQFVSDRRNLPGYNTEPNIPAGDEYTAVDAYVVQLINADVLTHGQDIITIKGDIAVLNESVDGLTNTVGDLVVSVDTINNTINGLSTDLVNLRSDHDVLSGNHDMLSTSYNNLSSKIGSFNNFGDGTLVDRFLNHTHTVESLGAAAVDHNHDSTYSAIDHNHDGTYSPRQHDHNNLYPLSLNLVEVGIYPNTVNVMIDNSEFDGDDPETPEIESPDNSVDCDDYTTQGSYFFDQANVRLINGPYGVLGGLLNVFSTDAQVYPVQITQLMYATDAVWKRHGVTTETTSTVVDEETGEESTVTTITTSFTNWLPLNESAPIGSWMFNNQAINVPRGYLEANGAIITNTAYPLLWKFVVENGALVTYENWSSNMCGSYGLVDSLVVPKEISNDNAELFAVSNVTDDNDEIVDTIYEPLYYIEDQSKHFVLLTKDNIDNFITTPPTTANCISKTVLESIDNNSPIRFHLPNLGGNFMKMWTAGSTDGTVGQYEEAGLPNITGSIDASAASIFEEVFGETQAANVNISGSFSGVFDSQYAVGTNTSGPTADCLVGFSFDASEANPIYGNSDTVTPENISTRVFIKAYNGALIPPDTAQSSVEAIIRSLLSNYSYASTTEAGFVRLATNEIVDGDPDNPTQPSVVTAAQLIAKDSNNVKMVVINGVSYTPDANTVTLPNFAPVEGNRTIMLTDGNGITCTTISDSSCYKDFIIPEEDAVDIADINSVDTSVTLKCMHAQNALGYPVGAIVTPMYAVKSVSQFEYLSEPNVVVFEDTTTYENNGGTLPKKRIVVRLYWPLMWYLRKFQPEEQESTIYPLTTTDTSVTADAITAIETECSYWTAQIKVSV